MVNVLPGIPVTVPITFFFLSSASYEYFEKMFCLRSLQKQSNVRVFAKKGHFENCDVDFFYQ